MRAAQSRSEGEDQRSTRRDFFSRIGDGLHGAALASLLGQDLLLPRTAAGATGERRVHDLRPR